ncbi:Uncharacterised protein [uncultured archaeon]|nr:Uncharacterised protein [uncultured archaeon]
MQNKKGLIGKIFLIIFLLIILVAGITAYQVYDLIGTINSQQNEIKSEITQLEQGDCSKISSIETRAILLELKANSACSNPIIYYVSTNYQGLPYTCNDIPTLKSQAEEGLSLAKSACDIRTLNNFTQEKITEYLNNLTQANYQQYAQQFNINISNQSQDQAIQTVKDYLSNQSNASK